MALRPQLPNTRCVDAVASPTIEKQKHSWKKNGCIDFGLKKLLKKNKRKSAVGSHGILHEYKHKIKDMTSQQAPRSSVALTNTSSTSSTSTRLIRSSPSRSQCDEVSLDTDSLYGTIGETKVPGSDTKLQTRYVTVQKKSSGFGLTVRGSCPVKVSRVKDAGAAAAAGLIRGDHIISINDADVSTSTAQSVVNIIKKSKKILRLEVYRPDHQMMLCKNDGSSYKENAPPGEQPVYENIEELRKEMRRESTCYQRKHIQEVRETTTTTSNITHTSPWKHGVSLITKETVCTQTVKDTRSISKVTQSQNHHGYRWQPDMSHIPRSKSQTSVFYKSSQNSRLHHVSMTTSDGDDTMWAPACPLVSEEGTISRHCGAYSDHSDSLTSSPCGGATFLDLSLSSEEHSSFSIQQAALQSLLECEQDFVDVMHRGIQMFSRPLRHHILTSQQHSNIFQNIEKLVIISEFHLHGLQDATSSDDVTHFLGDIYRCRVRMLSEGYSSYAAGLRKAFVTLDSLLQQSQLSEYLNKMAMCSKEQLTLDEFIQQPLLHFQSLVSCLQQSLLVISPSHPDHPCLQTVTELLTSVNSHIYREADQLQNLTKPNQQLLTRSHSLTETTASISSQDMEVIDLQNRLLFSHQVKPCHLANGSRHMIFSGHLDNVNSSRQEEPMNVALLSDLLLFTQPLDNSCRLVAMDEPLALTDIVNLNFDCHHPSEFTIVAEKCRSSGHIGRQAKHYTLRAVSPQEKWTWKHLLEQRVALCKSYSLTGNSEESSCHFI